MFEVDVKNVTEEEEEGREGKGRTRLGFLLGFLHYNAHTFVSYKNKTCYEDLF